MDQMSNNHAEPPRSAKGLDCCSLEPTTMATEPRDTPEPFTRLDGIHVLVVDDDEDARRICDAMLRYAGATVRVVGSALAAVRTLRHVRPDVVLTDLSMPRNDGLWLVDWIRARDARRRDHLPMVAITARDDLYDDATARRRGFDVYLRKPVPFRTLCATIAEVVGPAADEAARA
jgi:CheY-like chemotaxis protein